MSTSLGTCIDNSILKISRSEFNELLNRFRSGRYAWIVRERVSPLKGVVMWLEGDHRLVHPSGSEVLVHLYVVYNESYSLPQLCFSTAAWESLPQIHEFLPKLLLTHVAAQSLSHDSKSQRPLASYTYIDDLQIMVHAVHPCDTSSLIACGRLDGLRGDVLCVFLQVMAPLISLHQAFIPSG